MIRSSLGKLKLPQNFEKIHKELKAQGILGDYSARPSFPDEPQFYQFICERKVDLPHVKKGYGYGCSKDKAEAIVISIAEAIEHHCVLNEQENLLIKSSFKKLGKRAVNPTLFSSFTEKQLNKREFENFRFDENTLFNWVKAHTLPEKEEVFIPAQLVWANYDTQTRGEPVIRIPISTGAACGPDINFALYRGILETIERDNYMISYLNKLKPPVIKFPSSGYLNDFKRRIERYNLKLYVVETTLDFDTVSTVAVILDYSGMGPAVSVGLGASLNPTKAITGATLEAVRRHIASRDHFFRTKRVPSPPKDTTDYFIEQKLIYWSAPHMHSIIKPFISGPKKNFEALKDRSQSNNQNNFQAPIDQLKAKGYHVFFIDLATAPIKKTGLSVVKVLIPELLPLYHDERYPYKNNERLYNVPIKLQMRKARIREEEIEASHPF